MRLKAPGALGTFSDTVITSKPTLYCLWGRQNLCKRHTRHSEGWGLGGHLFCTDSNFRWQSLCLHNHEEQKLHYSSYILDRTLKEEKKETDICLRNMYFAVNTCPSIKDDYMIIKCTLYAKFNPYAVTKILGITLTAAYYTLQNLKALALMMTMLMICLLNKMWNRACDLFISRLCQCAACIRLYNYVNSKIFFFLIFCFWVFPQPVSHVVMRSLPH